MVQQCIHHIEIGVRENGEEFVSDLCHKLGLYRAGYRETVQCRQWLVRANSRVQLLVTEIRSSPTTTTQARREADIASDPYLVLWDKDTDEGGRPMRNSVFNVCLSVKNIGRQVDRLKKCGATMVKPVTIASDAEGQVKVAAVRSCLGNVVHTLVERQNYAGFFLPGFKSVPLPAEEEKTMGDDNGFRSQKSRDYVTHFDHVTFAAEVATSQNIIGWYEQAFGMKRFYLNSAEDEEEGFVINLPNVALRLKVFEYWKCAEIGLSSTTTTTTTAATASTKSHSLTNGHGGGCGSDGNCDRGDGDAGSNHDDDDGDDDVGDGDDDSPQDKVLFVIAESLKDSARNQVDTFLEGHKGPGIQHVALHSTDIVNTVSLLKQQGLEFVDPPFTYYQQINGMLQDLNMKEAVCSRLASLGILVDVEYDSDMEEQQGGGGDKTKYLLQKFSKPIFAENTFFFEVIQRMGATGFGANNIIALWKSLQTLLHTEQQQQQQLHTEQ